MQLNSVAENYRYMVVVVGSIPTVATKNWLVAQLVDVSGF
jgi:hypothetical protein